MIVPFVFVSTEMRADPPNQVAARRRRLVRLLWMRGPSSIRATHWGRYLSLWRWPRKKRVSRQEIQTERGDVRSDKHRTPETHDEIHPRAGRQRPRIVLGPLQCLRPEFNSKTVVRPCHNPTSRAVFNVRRCSTALQWIGAAEGFHSGIPSHLFPHPPMDRQNHVRG